MGQADLDPFFPPRSFLPLPFFASLAVLTTPDFHAG
jgi:hypothetical protein